ncbi:MAG: hypothetical protein SPL89_03415 [Clostridia bacterium]|nr:hypothetical protein [Clostridia bacterium]
MVRVWGGGHYPDDFFYDVCDEFGILVFQDLMFACMEVSADEEMHREIASEVTDNLKRLRHHACMAVISGNNEMEWQLPLEEKKRAETYLKVFEDLIPEIVKDCARNTVCSVIAFHMRSFCRPEQRGFRRQPLLGCMARRAAV